VKCGSPIVWASEQPPNLIAEEEVVAASVSPSFHEPEELCKMIDALKDDKIITMVGGRFRLCALIQKRLVQLMDGQRPMIDRDGRSDLEVAVEEILQGKLTYELDLSEEEVRKALPAEGRSLSGTRK